MAVIVFRRLTNEFESVRYSLAQNDYSEDTGNLLNAKLDVLTQISTYLHSYSWLKHKTSKERVKAFIASEYNYQACAEQLDVASLTAFQTSIWYAAKQFEAKIGKKTIDLISEGKTDEALIQFNTGTGLLGLVSLLPSEVAELFPDSKIDVLLTLSECTVELEFLKRIALNTLRKELLSVSKLKLRHLRYILESTDVRYAKHRSEIYKYLLGYTSSIDGLFSGLDGEDKV
jgi:hypothetical protein